MDIGRRIREIREDRGMPRSVLSRRVGAAGNTLYLIERGDRTPSVALLERIARELHTEPAELLREPVPLDDASQEARPPVVHFAKLSDNAYEEVRGNARTIEEREDLRRRLDLEYEQLRRWVRELKEEEEGGAPSPDLEEARELRKRAFKRYEVAVFDVSEMVIAFDEKRPPRLSRTAGKTVDEANEAIHGNSDIREEAVKGPEQAEEQVESWARKTERGS